MCKLFKFSLYTVTIRSNVASCTRCFVVTRGEESRSRSYQRITHIIIYDYCGHRLVGAAVHTYY